MKALRKIALGIAMLAVAAPGAAAKPVDDPSDRMIERINEVRAEHGLPALREAPTLIGSASGFARRLIRIDSFGHGSSYIGRGFRRSGEMIAMHRGWSRRAAPVVRQWMRSAVHSALILDRRFRYIGTGPARGNFGGAPTTIWVVHFGAH